MIHKLMHRSSLFVSYFFVLKILFNNRCETFGTQRSNGGYGTVTSRVGSPVCNVYGGDRIDGGRAQVSFYTIA